MYRELGNRIETIIVYRRREYIRTYEYIRNYKSRIWARRSTLFAFHLYKTMAFSIFHQGPVFKFPLTTSRLKERFCYAVLPDS